MGGTGTALTEKHLAEPVTNHLREDFPALDPDETVGEALAAMRAAPPSGRIIYFYVVDPDRRLVGVAPTRRLLLAPMEKKVGEVMIRNVIAVPASPGGFWPDRCGRPESAAQSSLTGVIARALGKGESA